MKKVWFVTLFPEQLKNTLSFGVLGKYSEKQDQLFNFVNPSDYCKKGFKGVDSAPYGGGPGMVMRADVLATTLHEAVFSNYNSREELMVIYPSPRGKTWNNLEGKNLASSSKDLVFICGRYEGVDERFLENYVDEEFSIGDYVLSGGEIAAAVIIDSCFRFLPGVLGNHLSALEDSFENNLLDSPKYTRPEVFESKSVPSILLSGNHQKIESFNKSARLEQTTKYRPDLLNCSKENLSIKKTYFKSEIRNDE